MLPFVNSNLCPYSANGYTIEPENKSPFQLAEILV